MDHRALLPTQASILTANEIPDAQVQVKEESPSLPSPTGSVARVSELSPSSSPSRAGRRSVGQRRASLRDDPLVEDVEPYRVYCRHCQKWIRLSSTVAYGMSNWLQHKQRCHDVDRAPSVRRTPSKPTFAPESKVATAERKIVLLNDPQVKAFGTGLVQCQCCKEDVALEGEVDYELTRWMEHKEHCIPMTPTPRDVPPRSTSSAHSQASVGPPARSPTPTREEPSSQSTEATAVTDILPAAVKIGVKRGREEETDEEENKKEEEVRPRKRPLREGMIEMLMRPLRAFVQGFREGLATE